MVAHIGSEEGGTCSHKFWLQLSHGRNAGREGRTEGLGEGPGLQEEQLLYIPCQAEPEAGGRSEHGEALQSGTLTSLATGTHPAGLGRRAGSPLRGLEP